MSADTILFGTYCDTQYSLSELHTLANKLRLITTRQNYNQLCNGLRTFFLKNGIFFCQDKDELINHIPRSLTIISETSTINKGKNIDIDILLNIVPPHFFEQVHYFERLQNYRLNSNLILSLASQDAELDLRLERPQCSVDTNPNICRNAMACIQTAILNWHYGDFFVALPPHIP